jgi:hypothetical protein
MVERRTGDDASVLADGLSGSAPPPVYGTDRICAEDGCGVRLSRYNSTDWCALHECPGTTGRPYDTTARPRTRRRNSTNRRRRTSVGRAA